MSIADKLTTVAENVPKIYEAGSKFLDNYLAYQYDCSYIFAGRAWYSETFKPTKDIRPTYAATRMFIAFDYAKRSGTPLDLVKRLDDLGVVLDFSKCPNTNEMFNSAYISHIGVIDLTKSTTVNTSTFGSAWIETIDELKVTENTKFSSTFSGATALENITITGTIGQNGFSVAQSTKLSPESITSIINALSTTTSGLTVTLSKTAVNNAFGINVDDPTTWAEGTEYYELRHSRDNWTITYV